MEFLGCGVFWCWCVSDAVEFLGCFALMLSFFGVGAVLIFWGDVFAVCRVLPVLTVLFLRVLGVFCGWSVVRLVCPVSLIFHFLKALD